MTAGQYIDIPWYAQNILAGVVAHFDAAGVDLPDRRVIAPGDTREISWDCEAVVVSMGGIGPGQAPGTGASAKQTGNPSSVAAQHAVFFVQIIRTAVDVGPNAAGSDQLTAAGLASMRDAAMLFQALQELCGRNGLLRRSGLAELGSVVPLGPADFTAVEGSLTVTAKDLA